jgi:hypothetical protein
MFGRTIEVSLLTVCHTLTFCATAHAIAISIAEPRLPKLNRDGYGTTLKKYRPSARVVMSTSPRVGESNIEPPQPMVKCNFRADRSYLEAAPASAVSKPV